MYRPNALTVTAYELTKLQILWLYSTAIRYAWKDPVCTDVEFCRANAVL